MSEPIDNIWEVFKTRRSIRKYTQKIVPESVMMKAFENAVLAPNSSNTQTWDFYWVKSQDKKQKLIEAALNQSAARTAQELVVVVADPSLWSRSRPHLVKWVESVNAPKAVQTYYRKLIPLMYSWGLFNIYGLFKWIAATVIGLFRPIMRGPFTKRAIQEVAIKSAALASENFVLAIRAQGFDTCMMEGFDEKRVRKILDISSSARVVMVISVGEAAERGTWGPQYRLPVDLVVHKV